MKILNQKGSILLFAVVAMTVILVVGTGIYFMTTTATFSGLDANAQNRAYQLAVAGRDYALVKNLTAAEGGYFTFTNGDKFRLQIGVNNPDEIISTGIVKEDTPYEAKRTITITKTGFSSQSDISFAKDIASFSPSPDPLKQTAQAGFVSVDQVAAQISLGQYQASKFGSVWYSGSSAHGNCQSGECDFGTGFRAYFMFKLERQSSDIPHGFTFAVFNGAENSYTSAGGDVGLPELLAYGGDSCTSRNSWSPYTCNSFLDPAGQGIHPPKIAVEFDGRQNCCDSPAPPSPCTIFSDIPSDCRSNVCNTDTNSNSRSDGSKSHMAYVFWGDNTTACATKDNSLTYDDNRHGAGDPVNASILYDSVEASDYFAGIAPAWTSEWLYNTTKVYAVRIEVTRASNLNANSKYFYTINAWIKRCSGDNISDPAACVKDENNNDINPDFDNTKVAYNPTPVDSPILKRTIELNTTLHGKFDKFLFGWTAAAGGQSRENMTLSNFQMYFAREPVACGGYGVWNNMGSTRYFKINGSVCTTVVNGSKIGNIGPSGSIDGFTNATCTITTSPVSISYNQAMSADTNKNCAVNFSGSDK